MGKFYVSRYSDDYVWIKDTSDNVEEKYTLEEAESLCKKFEIDGLSIGRSGRLICKRSTLGCDPKLRYLRGILVDVNNDGKLVYLDAERQGINVNLSEICKSVGEYAICQRNVYNISLTDAVALLPRHYCCRNEAALCQPRRPWVDVTNCRSSEYLMKFYTSYNASNKFLYDVTDLYDNGARKQAYIRYLMLITNGIHREDKNGYGFSSLLSRELFSVIKMFYFDEYFDIRNKLVNIDLNKVQLFGGRRQCSYVTSTMFRDIGNERLQLVLLFCENFVKPKYNPVFSLFILYNVHLLATGIRDDKDAAIREKYGNMVERMHNLLEAEGY